MIGTPSARRRMVGAALRRYRENLGYNLEEAARTLECDCSKISRIETGQRSIRALELRALLEEYGADEDERRALSAIADPRARGWWQHFPDVLSEAYQEYAIVEAAASVISVYENHRVPELLQTGLYACAIAAADPVAPAAPNDRAAQAALARQKVILAQDRPGLAVVIGEGALHQLVGGEAVMREQCGHLAAISKVNAKVTIQVLPFAAGAHAAIGGGPMTVLGFAQTSSLGMVHLASIPGGVFLDGQEEVACYNGVFRRLQALALPPGESARLLQEMAGS